METNPIERTCSVCGKDKPVTDFHKESTPKSGYCVRCKPCESDRCLKYKRSKEGVISKMYSHQKERSKRRGHPKPEYSKQELKEWLFSKEQFHQLYEKWVDSDYDRLKKPSVDRINDYGSYRLNNIQLMSCEENCLKGSADIKNGFNTKTSVSIAQHSLDGKFIQRFHSQKQAQRETGVWANLIGKCRKGEIPEACGFIWK